MTLIPFPLHRARPRPAPDPECERIVESQCRQQREWMIAAGKSPDEIEREVAELGRAIRATLAPSGAA
jgi:hypothetical protein